MAQSSSPYGVQPISDQNGVGRPVRIPGGVFSGYAANIFKYQPVRIDVTHGTLNAVTAANQAIFGVFAGVEYTPPGGRPTVSPFWPTGATWDAGYDMFVYIWPAWIPGVRFKVQADGAVAQALLGSQFNLSNFTNGSTSTGLSTCTVAAAGVAASSQGQFALTEFATDVNPLGGEVAPGDAFTDLIMTIALPQVGLGIQTSIG